MRKRKYACAFTLVEMLVVIVIIGILAGIVLKLMSLAKRSQERAACVAIIERVSYALNEYRAEYGQYPAVPPATCPGYLKCYRGRTSDGRIDCRTCYITAPGDGGSTPPPSTILDYFKSASSDSTLYRYGLVSYLIPRIRSNIFTNNASYVENQDNDRDQVVKKRWEPFLSGMVSGRDNWGGDGIEYTNLYVGAGSSAFNYYVPIYTFQDPWGNTLRYKSDPPYSSFDLWSPGPDEQDGEGGATGTADKAKDNMHYKRGRWDG